MWLSEKWKVNSNVGVSVSKVENAEMISPAREIAKGSIAFYGIIGSAKHCKKANTLWGFFNANESDYPSLVWSDYKPTNSMDI
jgi:hypothetical protein